MLGKLLKYDIKAVARYMLPLYALLLISTCGMKTTLELADNTVVNVFRFVFIAAYIISLIAIVTGSLIMLILHFYRNLMTDQGYLSFTLPVTPTAHLGSKLLNGCIWILLTVVAVILSVLILTAGHIGPAEWRELLDIFRELGTQFQEMGFGTLHLVLYLVLCPLLGLFGTQITVYFCICAGQWFFGNHRVLGAFVVYFCYYVLNQIISVILLLLNSSLFTSELVDMAEFGELFTGLIGGELLWVTFSYVAMFFGSRWILSRRLNLE